MSEHPPVPPNCEWFGKYNDGEAYCQLPATNCKWLMPLNLAHEHHLSKINRQYIAAMARCGWADEWHRLKAMDVGLFTSEEALEIHREKLSETQVNAEAWREWGMR